MASISEKIDQSRVYAWKQIESWCRQYYNAPVQVEVHASRDLKKEGKLAKTVFDGTIVPKVYIDYNLLREGKKKEILYAACREAIRIGLAFHQQDFSDLSPMFRAELQRHKLPDYGGLTETGVNLFTYRCIGCKKPYALRYRRMKPKDVEFMCYNPKVTTECCGKMVEDVGKVYYNNNDLQNLTAQFRIDIEDLSKT